MLVGHRFGTKVVAGGKIDLAGGKIISRGREIILSRGKNSLAGGKSFWQVNLNHKKSLLSETTFHHRS